jgi:hypothetical protein
VTFLAGQKLRASELNEIIPIIGYATSTSTKTSSTAMADATGVAVPLAADSLYALEGWIAYTAGATGDLKVALTGPSGLTGHWGTVGLSSGSTGGTGTMTMTRQTAFADGTTVAIGGSDASSGVLHASLFGYLDTSSTAGNLQLRFAQNTSNATSTTIAIGTWIHVIPLST